jgi:hypothetical protein
MPDPIGPRSLAALAAALVLATTAAAPAAYAQEVGVFGTAVRTDHPELGRATGYGGSASVRIMPMIWLRGTYQERSGRTRHATTTCAQYWPYPENCTPDALESDAKLRTWAGLVVADVPLRDGIRWEFGTGSSRSRVRAENRTDSGRDLGLHVPEDETHRGLVIHGAAVLQSVLGTPLSAAVEGVIQSVDFGGCPFDMNSFYCGATRFDEVRVGLRYRF